MALHDEHADILGGPILQRPAPGVPQYHLVFKSLALLGLSLLVWITCARGLEHLKKHRELRCKKAMRRKHGIPDSDCRPFAVAYAAAKRAHLEREAQGRKKTTNYVLGRHSQAAHQRANAQQSARGLRRRVPETTVQPHESQLPGKHALLYDDKRPEAHPLDFDGRYHPSSSLRHRMAIQEPLFVELPPARRAGRKDLVISPEGHEESRKRSFEDECEVEREAIKKFRIGGHELIDGDQQADWYAQYSDVPPGQRSREILVRQPEGHYVHNLRDEDHEPADEAMEGVGEGEVTGLGPVVRGKKRDRAEAGSTFGGDDDEDIRNGRLPRHRKRRTILQATEEPIRRQKRGRGAESFDSDGEESGSEICRRRAQRRSKKQRSKKAASNEIIEMPVDDSGVPKDPLYDGRKIGDEWEADGIQYKVGDKGERLRLTLVKKARNKYHMPQDSQHPDRSAALEIYVETWMTDEQYKQAEGRHALAWQEVPREVSKTPDILDSPTKSGKNLLWDSVRSSPACRPFRQFIPANASTRISPLEQWQLQPTLGRRVASSSVIISPILPGAAESLSRAGFRGFSKWEKQDREAEAIARIRAKVEEQKKVQVPPQISAEITASVTAPELGTQLLSVPTITLTPVAAVAAEGEPDNSTSLSKSNTSTSCVATPSTNESVKDTISTTALGFSQPSASISAATASPHFASTQTAPTTTSSTASHAPFSFAKPSQIPSSISTTASLSAASNTFGKGVGTPSVSNPLPSVSGPQPQFPPTAGTSKPVPFSFAKPDTLSALSPAAVAPSTTKSQMLSFGTTSASSPFATFSSTPAVTKGGVPVPPPLPTSATMSESSKPTAPLFSFPSASPAPKFSFGQSSSATSMSASGFNFAPSTTSQSKSTFKFGQTPPVATDSGTFAPTVLGVDEPNKSAAPVSVFSTAADSNGPGKPPSFGTTSAFGNIMASSSASAPIFFGKPVAANGGSSTSTPPKSMLASPGNPTFNNAFSSTPAGISLPGNTPIFSFGGTSSGSKSAEGSKSTPLFGSATGSSKPVSMFGGGSTEGKPTFTSNVSAEDSKPASIFGGNTVGSKPLSVPDGSAEKSKHASAFGGTADGSNPTFATSGTTEYKSTSGSAMGSLETPDSSTLPNTTDISKLTPTPGSTTFGSSSPALAFTFRKKDDAVTSTSASTSIQTKPASLFTFGASSDVNGSTFGQPTPFGTGGESSQTVFVKPANTSSNAFGLVGTVSSGSSGTFTFGKPAPQSQKQEQ